MAKRMSPEDKLFKAVTRFVSFDTIVTLAIAHGFERLEFLTRMSRVADAANTAYWCVPQPYRDIVVPYPAQSKSVTHLAWQCEMMKIVMGGHLWRMTAIIEPVMAAHVTPDIQPGWTWATWVGAVNDALASLMQDYCIINASQDVQREWRDYVLLRTGENA